MLNEYNNVDRPMNTNLEQH